MSQGNNPAPVVSVVVPARNEAGNIGPLVEEIATVLQGRAFEVVCVNDGSEDTTEEELRSLMTQFPWLRQIVHAQVLRSVGSNSYRCSPGASGHHCYD